MDIATSLSGLKQAQTVAKVQVAVAKKVLDSQRDQGAAAVKLIDAATEGFSKQADALSVAATGLGGNLDVTG